MSETYYIAKQITPEYKNKICSHENLKVNTRYLAKAQILQHPMILELKHNYCAMIIILINMYYEKISVCRNVSISN